MSHDPKAIQKAMEFASSDAGRALYQTLHSTDTHALQQAMAKAATGDYEAVKNTLLPLLSNPEIRKMLNDMGGQHG